ncbi:unnamed protein product, partial [Ectocarpus sp. 12 AP-2014]
FQFSWHVHLTGTDAAGLGSKKFVWNIWAEAPTIVGHIFRMGIGPGCCRRIVRFDRTHRNRGVTPHPSRAAPERDVCAHELCSTQHRLDWGAQWSTRVRPMTAAATTNVMPTYLFFLQQRSG